MNVQIKTTHKSTELWVRGAFTLRECEIDPIIVATNSFLKYLSESGVAFVQCKWTLKPANQIAHSDHIIFMKIQWSHQRFCRNIFDCATLKLGFRKSYILHDSKYYNYNKRNTNLKSIYISEFFVHNFCLTWLAKFICERNAVEVTAVLTIVYRRYIK